MAMELLAQGGATTEKFVKSGADFTGWWSRKDIFSTPQAETPGLLLLDLVLSYGISAESEK